MNIKLAALLFLLAVSVKANAWFFFAFPLPTGGSSSPYVSSPSVSSHTPTAASIKLDDLWVKQDITSDQVNDGVIFYALNKVSGLGITLSSTTNSGDAAIEEYIKSKIKKQKEILDKGVVSQEKTEFKNGVIVRSYLISGNIQNESKTPFSYLLNFYIGKDQVLELKLFAKTSILNSHKSVLLELEKTITGLTPLSLDNNDSKKLPNEKSIIETKLEELRALQLKGLISKQDYESKKDQILKSF